MIILKIILIAIVLAAALYIWMIAPSMGRKRAKAWEKTIFAHRGQHGNGVDENTVEAFDIACKNGFGSELDVQLSRDGEVVVFHDDDLLRMTGDKRMVDEVDYAELKGMVLPCGSGIPTFKEVLETVNGRTPLLVEIKNGRRNDELCEKTMALLKDYKGAYVMESFSPLIVRWLRKNVPHIIRGQLVCTAADYGEDKKKSVCFMLANLLLNFLGRPDFVAYDINAEKFSAPKIQHAIFRTPMATWTVKDEGLFYESLNKGEMPIFEGFMPEKK